MALQPCRECGEQISTEAVTCPHCGIQDPAGGESGRCYGCGETVTLIDNFCPLCGVEDPLVPFAEAQKRRGSRYGTSPPPAVRKRQEASARSTTFSGVAWLFAGLSLVFLAVVVFTGSPSTSTSGESEASRKMSVAMGCEQAIQERLRSPRSATFPRNMSDGASRQPDGSYVLRSYVDAQNAFGAEVRANFVCRGTPADGGVVIHEARLLGR